MIRARPAKEHSITRASDLISGGNLGQFASRRAFALLVLFLSMLASAPRAEIVESGAGCAQGCRWPKLPHLTGWHSDERANITYGENGLASLVPDGTNFQDADAVIYGQAFPKARLAATDSGARTLAAFIAGDKAAFVAGNKQIVIAEAPALATADGQKLSSFTFFRSQDKTWERVCYGEEAGYFLVFAISAHSEAGYRSQQAAFEYVIQHYRP